MKRRYPDYWDHSDAMANLTESKRRLFGFFTEVGGGWQKFEDYMLATRGILSQKLERVKDADDFREVQAQIRLLDQLIWLKQGVKELKDASDPDPKAD